MSASGDEASDGERRGGRGGGDIASLFVGLHGFSERGEQFSAPSLPDRARKFLLPPSWYGQQRGRGRGYTGFQCDDISAHATRWIERGLAKSISWACTAQERCLMIFFFNDICL